MIRNNIVQEEIEFISRALSAYYPLSEESKQLLLQRLKREERKKGDILFAKKEDLPRVYFLVKGIAKSFVTNDKGNEEISSFYDSGEIIVNAGSYFENIEYSQNLFLYENTVLYYTEISFIKSLFETKLEWANWGRCVVEQYVLELSDFFDVQKNKKAKERYTILVEKYPEIYHRIPLQDIANFLGITPVSLSRIRANLARSR